MSQTEFNKLCLHILVHYTEPFSAVFHDVADPYNDANQLLEIVNCVIMNTGIRFCADIGAPMNMKRLRTYVIMFGTDEWMGATNAL